MLQTSKLPKEDTDTGAQRGGRGWLYGAVPKLWCVTACSGGYCPHHVTVLQTYQTMCLAELRPLVPPDSPLVPLNNEVLGQRGAPASGRRRLPPSIGVT